MTVGPGWSDRHNQTVSVELTGAVYLLLRDSRYRERGWGKQMRSELGRQLGFAHVSGWSGHPDHKGTWDLWRLDGPLTVEAGQQNRWRLTVAANGEASLERLSVAL